MENKKIRNATQNTSKGITFKSMLEKSIYNTLLQQGFKPLYEFKTFTLWDGFTPLVPYFDKETDNQRQKRLEEGVDTCPSKMLVRKENKIIGIRYTPDFYFNYNGLNVYIEAKGVENDVFYIKKKMFLKYLSDRLVSNGEMSVYFEIYTKKQLIQAIDLIKHFEQWILKDH